MKNSIFSILVTLTDLKQEGGMGWDRNGTGWDGMGRVRDGHLNIKMFEKFQLPYHSYAKPILENTLLWSFRSIHEKWYFFYFGYFNRSGTEGTG